MRFLTLKNLFFTLLLLSIIISIAGCSTKAQISKPIAEAQKNPKPIEEVKPCATEPIYGLIPNDPKSKNMEAAWKQFIADGRYRLTCDSDGDFALDTVEPKTIQSYSRDKQSSSVTNWGDWSYPKRVSEDHLAAIVVDTTRTDDNRFGLVVFSPPQSKKTAYDINWLYRERNLSRASVGMASGSGWVEDFTADGKRRLCWIVWNKSKKVFECKYLPDNGQHNKSKVVRERTATFKQSQKPPFWGQI